MFLNNFRPPGKRPWAFGYGAIYFLDGVLCSIGLFQLQHSQPGYYAARGVVEMIVGILFMKGFPPFVDIAFPPSEPPPPDKSREETKEDA